MLLVELPLFARSGLGVGIAINTIMSSGSILSCLVVLFFSFSNNTKDINCFPWKSFTQCHSLPTGCGPLLTARPSIPWCHRWLTCHLVTFLGSIPHGWSRSNKLNWGWIPGQAEHPRGAEDLCWSGGPRSCPCTGYDLLFFCNIGYFDSFVIFCNARFIPCYSQPTRYIVAYIHKYIVAYIQIVG